MECNPSVETGRPTVSSQFDLQRLTAYRVAMMKSRCAQNDYHMIGIPAPSFLNMIGVNYHLAKRANLGLVMVEIQRVVHTHDKTVIVGWDVKHDKICWYVLRGEEKPQTQVPFIYNYKDWPEPNDINPVDVVDAQIWKSIETNWTECQRVTFGQPIPRKPWYQRPSGRKN